MNRFFVLFLVSTSVCFSAEHSPRPGSPAPSTNGVDKGSLLKAPVPMSMGSAPAPSSKKVQCFCGASTNPVCFLCCRCLQWSYVAACCPLFLASSCLCDCLIYGKISAKESTAQEVIDTIICPYCKTKTIICPRHLCCCVDKKTLPQSCYCLASSCWYGKPFEEVAE